MMGFIENEWIIFLKQLKWQFIIGLSLLYVGAFRGFFILLSEAKWQTIIVCYFLSKFFIIINWIFKCEKFVKTVSIAIDF